MSADADAAFRGRMRQWFAVAMPEGSPPLRMHGYGAAECLDAEPGGDAVMFRGERGSEPFQPSRNLGAGYVGWLFRGSEAGKALPHFKGLPGVVRCTRFDVAADVMSCSYTPDDVRRKFGGSIRADVQQKFFTSSTWMGTDKQTFYLGSSQTGKLLRVYSKGLLMLDADGPNIRRTPPIDPKWIRFEMQYRRTEHAGRLWPILRDDLPAAFDAFRADLARWVPGCVPGECVAVPPEPKLPSDGVRAAAHLVRTYAPLISAMRWRGLSAVDLSMQYLDGVGGRQERRWCELADALKSVSPADVLRVAREGTVRNGDDDSDLGR